MISVLSNNGHASRVPETWIAALQKAESYGLFDRTSNAPQPFDIGEKVKISEGPFAGQSAIVQEFLARLRSGDAGRRVKVLVEMLGRLSTVELPMHELEKL